MDNHCEYCGEYHQGVCPLVLAITYYPDGSKERVEFRKPPRVARKPRNRLNAVDAAKRAQEVIALYEGGSGIIEIAAAYNMSRTGIHGIILRNAPHLYRHDGTHAHGVPKK